MSYDFENCEQKRFNSEADKVWEAHILPQVGELGVSSQSVGSFARLLSNHGARDVRFILWAVEKFELTHIDSLLGQLRDKAVSTCKCHKVERPWRKQL